MSLSENVTYYRHHRLLWNMNRFEVIPSALFKQNMISKIIFRYIFISSRKYFTFFPHKLDDSNLNGHDG